MAKKPYIVVRFKDCYNFIEKRLDLYYFLFVYCSIRLRDFPSD